MIYAIIKNNYVIDRVVSDEEPTYPFDYDFIIAEVDFGLYIGDYYDEQDKIFYRSVGKVNIESEQ